MITKEQITDWFCERNQIRKEELDKCHRYAIATAFKYAEEQVKNLIIPAGLAPSEQLPTDDDCINAIKKQLNDNGFKTE